LSLNSYPIGKVEWDLVRQIFLTGSCKAVYQDRDPCGNLHGITESLELEGTSEGHLVQLSCIEAIALGMTPLVQPVIQVVSSSLSAESQSPARGTEENTACTADPFNTFPRDTKSFVDVL